MNSIFGKDRCLLTTIRNPEKIIVVNYDNINTMEIEDYCARIDVSNINGNLYISHGDCEKLQDACLGLTEEVV